MNDIVSATNNFDDAKLIGRGGFGKVYKGKLSLPEGQITVAFKRLYRHMGQGNREFWKEIMTLSKYKHENLVSLMHFCRDGSERILVYEYASRGSLDCYLSDASVTWTQRLKICLGAARGLSFLHDPTDTFQRVIHRDIKSANILLDDNWIAKVSDFGLSTASPANQSQTYLISNAAGTLGYCDPLYIKMGLLSKESDIYSFGVVLFEVLCGTLCYNHDNGVLNLLVPTWRKYFEEDKLDEIIFSGLQEQMEPGSLKLFSALAYRCVKKSREERPTMAEIIQELELALKQQEVFEDLENKVNLEEIIKVVKLAGVSYESQNQLILLLLKGILVDDGKTFLSINKKGETCEMISALKCISEDHVLPYSLQESRFGSGRTTDMFKGFKVEVSTQFLLPHVTYTINLVLKRTDPAGGTNVPFKYKLEQETQYSNPCIVDVREDGWLAIELYQFTSSEKGDSFSIDIAQPLQYYSSVPMYFLEGIEFRPVERESPENQEDENKIDMQCISDSDIYWERKLMNDYTKIITLSKEKLEWTTKKELYFLLRKGFLVDNYEKKWFSMSKDMKERLMIPARASLLHEQWTWNSLPESRFGEIAEFPDGDRFIIKFQLKYEILSPQTHYSCHIIYKLPEDDSSFQHHIQTTIDDPSSGSNRERLIFLVTPPLTPVIGPKTDQDHIQPRTRKLKGHPRLRKDGWMEFQFCEISTGTSESINMEIEFNGYRNENVNFLGLVVQGIEIRPL
ncbi:kinase-like domain, phloem protein 2-like protein [Tanacetum coccineum]